MISDERPGPSGRGMARTGLELFKFGLVGILNTLITYTVIVLCTVVFSFHYMAANVLGYAAGIINSFLLNRRFTFKSTGDVKKEAVRFTVVTAVCYVIQALAVTAMMEFLLPFFNANSFFRTLSGLAAAAVSILPIDKARAGSSDSLVIQLAGMVIYTLLGYAGNRYFTFTPVRKPDPGAPSGNHGKPRLP